MLSSYISRQNSCGGEFYAGWGIVQELCRMVLCMSGYCVRCRSYAADGSGCLAMDQRVGCMRCLWAAAAGRGQACIPCKVDCLHLTDCTNCIHPPSFPTYDPSPSRPLPSLPPQFSLPLHFYPLPHTRFCRLLPCIVVSANGVCCI